MVVVDHTGRNGEGNGPAGFPVKEHFAGHGQPVFPFVQAADAVAQFHRQHGQHPVHQVHAGAPFIGFLVQQGVGLHIIAYIGDIDPQEVVVPLFFHIHSIVQVLGIHPVDGDDVPVPPVQPVLDFLLFDLLLHFFCRFLDRSREFGGQVVVFDDGKDFQADIPGFPQDLHDFSFRVPPFVRPGGDFHHHLFLVPGSVEVLPAHVNVPAHPFVVRDHEAEFPGFAEGSHQFVMGPVQDPDDFPFLPVVKDTFHHPGHDRIPVHGPAEAAGRDEQVPVFRFFFRDHKGKALAGHLAPAHHQAHGRRQPVGVEPGLHHLAPGFQFFHHRPEQLQVRALQGQRLDQFIGGKRGGGMVLHVPQDLCFHFCIDHSLSSYISLPSASAATVPSSRITWPVISSSCPFRLFTLVITWIRSPIRTGCRKRTSSRAV